jgi:hypothetical protein
MLLSGDKRPNAGGRNASSAPRQRSDHSSAARTGVGLDFLNFPAQPLEAWAHRCPEFLPAFGCANALIASLKLLRLLT